MHRAFVEPQWIEAWLKDVRCPLPAEIVRRFITIVRVKANEEIAIFDGTGRQITGYLAKNPSDSSYYIAQGHIKLINTNAPQIILAQAAISETKLVETLRRGCEFGIDKFIIFPAHKSNNYCLEKLKKRETRLLAVLQDAARQSERLTTPSLIFATKLQDFLHTGGIFGDLKSTTTLSTILKEKFSPDFIADFLIIIGPEGGLGDEEISCLKSSGFFGVRFGPYTQRTELACLAAVAIFNAFCGRA
jgi:16S rRNA (uracil1498-N3)-methyltransferase